MPAANLQAMLWVKAQGCASALEHPTTRMHYQAMQSAPTHCANELNKKADKQDNINTNQPARVLWMQ
jgi:hypothetical protein